MLQSARRWTINGRFLSQPLTGVQRYGLEIVRALDHAMRSGHPLTGGLVLEVAIPSGTTEVPDWLSLPVKVLPGRAGHAWEQTSLLRGAAHGLLSLCNTGPVAHWRHIACLHDASTRSAPGSYTLPFRMTYRTLHPLLGRTCARIATVSAYSASDLVRFGICPADRITVIPNGHEHVHQWTPIHTLETKHAAGPDTILVVGSLAPHKNIQLLLGLAPRLEKAGIRLAIAGISDPRLFSSADGPIDAPNISWLGRISDDALAALLRDCLCLCFPSRAEGFGIPALEAMALGCPVISSTWTSLPEVCRAAALYADPNDPDAWYRQIVKLRHDAHLRSQLRDRGQLNAQHFSWYRSADAYLWLMARVDGATRQLAQSGKALPLPI